MLITFVNSKDDLGAIAEELSASKWGADNDMATYTKESLQHFLDNANNLLAVGRVDDKIVCSALCYVLDHPDKTRKSLYIDELDTHPDHRRMGYASAMISWLKDYAAKRELSEAWLGTEANDNQVANAFYASLHPTEIELCNLYSFSAVDKE